MDISWRVTTPARVIGANTCLVPPDQYPVFLAPHDFHPFPWSATDEGDFEWPAHEGTAIWTRPDPNQSKHIWAMTLHGIPTCAEVDDNYLSDPKLNLFMKVHGYDKAGQDEHRRSMGLADRVICSTRWLADRYYKELKKAFGWKPDVRVCRNHVDLAEWPERDEGDGRLRVGWMGSAQHARDIKLAFGAMAYARMNGCEVILMGHDVRDKQGVTHRRGREGCDAWASVITRHVPWIDPSEYHRRALPFDIGLAPLELNDHTLGKSDIKAIEYAMSGAVPVLQSHPVYTAEWRHNETCLMAGSPWEFKDCVRELVNSRSLRERLVSGAQQYVREERSNEAIKREWGEAVA